MTACRWAFIKGEKKQFGDSSLVVVHSKDATFDNSHVPGPDSMVPEKQKDYKCVTFIQLIHVQFVNTCTFEMFTLILWCEIIFINTTIEKFVVSKMIIIFFFFLFSKAALNWSNVTVKTYKCLIQIKWYSFELSIHQIILKKYISQFL